jgi:hypothetical protein
MLFKGIFLLIFFEHLEIDWPDTSSAEDPCPAKRFMSSMSQAHAECYLRKYFLFCEHLEIDWPDSSSAEHYWPSQTIAE